jgi:hypothetical protein
MRNGVLGDGRSAGDVGHAPRWRRDATTIPDRYGGSIIREPCAWQEAQQIRIIVARNFDAFLPSNIWVANLGVYLPKKTCPRNLAQSQHLIGSDVSLLGFRRDLP